MQPDEQGDISNLMPGEEQPDVKQMKKRRDGSSAKDLMNGKLWTRRIIL